MPATVAIHQPNFFPWLGYFEKIVRCDRFVFLDIVQYPKTGGTWMNRVKLLINGEARWITAPIVRNYHGFRSVTEMEFQESENWRENILKTIETNYRRAPFFNEVCQDIEPLVLNPEINISDYNIKAIISIADRLSIPPEKFSKSSELDHKGSSNELLASLTLALGADTYMCGGGADGYQDEAVFNSLSVSLLYQNFQHPKYEQIAVRDFVPGLSIIDAAMNLGWKQTRGILGIVS